VKVGLFVTCLVDLVRPRIGFATLELLESAGCEVVVPQTQTCCGQPGYNAGDRASALALARKVVAEFEDCDYVVAPSGSCAGMIRTHYPDLFRSGPEELGRARALSGPEELARVRALSEKTYELTDFLVSVLRIEKVPGRFEGAVTYHDACAGLRELGVKTQPRALLAKAGATIDEMSQPEQCCGFGGTFSIKFGDISAHIAERKCQDIAATGAGTVVLGDLGCMLNIEGRLRRRGDTTTRVLHVAEVLTGKT
jgi:L-lactate dehydrogenase complex protein LldE